MHHACSAAGGVGRGQTTFFGAWPDCCYPDRYFFRSIMEITNQWGECEIWNIRAGITQMMDAWNQHLASHKNVVLAPAGDAKLF